MPAVPRFILDRLYVAGSMCNTPEGCEFAVRNKLGEITVVSVERVGVDGIAFAGTFNW